MVSEFEREQIRQCMRALRDGLNGFQTRRAQLQMIAAVAHALGSCRQDDEHAMTGENIAVCQCGTGTGKSIAASVPALVMAKSRGKRLVISSSTIALQHQYSEKDIPALQRVLPLDFTFAVAKGRRRYACTAKLFAVLDDLRQKSLGLGESDEPVPGPGVEQTAPLRDLVRLAEAFEAGGWSGDRDELSVPVRDDLWEKITTDRQGCSGNRCPQFATCPFYAARQRLKEVDLAHRQS